MIYHIVPKQVWQAQLPDQPYCHASLESEGFIHCIGAPPLLVRVANHFYGDAPGDFVILCIDEARVQEPVQWDPVGDQEFPHIYGPLNLDAVVGVVDFPRQRGKFLMPPELTEE